ncbi:MAG: hypothetical protein PUC24_06120, partial [Oscillospiraceae bacterium]|nr:hypothetical protein [Oscillospiraceae bacterium]
MTLILQYLSASFKARNFMRSIAHHDHRQKPERMKFLRIIFGCPEGAGKWRILFFAMRLHRKKRQERSSASFQPADITRNRISVMPADIFLSDKAVKGRNQLTRRHKKAILKNTEESKFATA